MNTRRRRRALEAATSCDDVCYSLNILPLRSSAKKNKRGKIKSRTMSDESKISGVSCAKCRCCVEENVRTVTLDFGEIAVDSTVTKTLNITNGTCNEENYEIHRDPTTNPLDAVFHLDKYSWSLKPGNSSIRQVCYNPLLPNERSVDYFRIVNRDKTILKIIARGSSVGPNASILMGDFITMICSPNEISKKRVKIVNHSKVPANFIFDIDDKQSSFKPDPKNGSIAPNSHVYIVVTFAPKFSGYHVCHLPCLIQHQAPLMLLFYGYCGEHHRNEKSFAIPTLIHPFNDKNGFECYMGDGNHTGSFLSSDPFSAYPVSLSHCYMDFGRYDGNYQGSLKHESCRTTCFTNHSNLDMLLKWDEDVEGIFSVTPNKVRIKAGETCLFEVRFNPIEKNLFYGRELKALIFFVDIDTSSPIYSSSMIASLRVIGHTFSADSSGWIPQYHVPRTIIMPPCLPSTPVYTTLVIKRFGHLPIMYRFIPPPETCFNVKPMQGIIHENYQVVIIEMFPKVHDKLLYERWAIRFNGNPNYEAFVDFRGYAENPSLNFNEQFVEFPSTHPGCEQTKHVFMLNPTRHTIDYRFVDIPLELSVDKIQGKIYSNEVLTHNWIFCPSDIGDHEFFVVCKYKASSSFTWQIRLRLVGKSELGYLEATPSELNFGELPYDATKKLNFALTNLGKVEIPYELNLKPENWPYEEYDMTELLSLDPISGTLFPGDKEKIEVTLESRGRGHHRVSIQYSIRKNVQTSTLIFTNEPKQICQVEYFCRLPLIKIEDLLHYRIGHEISKYILWKMLNINELNQKIDDLRPGERQDVKMHLPPTILHEDMSIIKLLVSNPTSAIANWSIERMKICSCPKVSEKRSLTFHRMVYNCQHRKLCKIHPKSGTLKAYEKDVITVELRYELLGETTIRFNFNIGHDRRVILSLSINCLSELEKTAFLLYGSTIKLTNIFIGDRDPINQICWIYNPTKNDIPYSLDMNALRQFNSKNPTEILECPNPSGLIKQMSQKPLILKFKPRKLGPMEVTLPLTIGTETTEITIKGQGVNFSSSMPKISFPHHDLFHIDEIPVHFSTDSITLSSMPLHGRATRMIMIQNRLEHELIAYKWKSYELPGMLKINLEPETGRIQAGSLQTFRLIVVSGDKPCRINARVTCEFINQSGKRAYERSVLMHKRMCEQMKDYFTITEKGTTYPKPEEMVLKEPEPFYKVLTVRCITYSPNDEKLKTTAEERLKNTPAIEFSVEKRSKRIFVPRETLTLSRFLLEGIIWDILQSTNFCKPLKSKLRYSQIAIKPLVRKAIQERSYVRPSGRIIEKILENMIFMIVHKEFALDMIHLTRKSDARQATYPKIWHQVSGQEGSLEQSPKIQ